MLPLADNYPEDEFEYELHVHTGLALGSGTKSNVFFRIYGTEAETGVRRLDDKIRQVLEICEIMNSPQYLPLLHSDLECRFI